MVAIPKKVFHTFLDCDQTCFFAIFFVCVFISFSFLPSFLRDLKGFLLLIVIETQLDKTDVMYVSRFFT